MKSLIVFWILFLTVIHLPLDGAFEEIPAGARSVALGMTGTADEGRIDAVWMNPACLATLDNWQVALYLTRPFGLKEVSHQTFCLGRPLFKGGIGITLQSFGARYYHEQQFSLAWATQIENQFSLGLRVRTGRLAIDRYGSTMAWMMDWGLLYRPLPRFQLGASLTNALRARLGQNRKALPQSLRLGIQIKPAENVKINLDLIKDSRFPVQIAGGVEIQILPIWCVRAGFSNQPNYLCGGFGFQMRGWNLDYGYAIHPVLGGTHHISLLFLDISQ
ncbi:hypothetical protein HQ585_10085 [candidate division KSB1 bacterium]|nr:hypothetical protein [candidate division KSB1 bacterium]